MTRGRFTFAALLAAVLLGGGAAAVASAPAAKRYLAFVRGGSTSPESVWVANADGSDPRRLGAGSDPLISPDGGYIAVQHFVAHGLALEIFSTDGKLLGGFVDAAKDIATPVAWSPDSRYVAVSLSSTGTTGGGALELIDATKLKGRLIATGAIAGASFNAAGTQLVYGLSRSVQLTSPTNLYEAGVAGGASRPLTTNGNSFEPVWTRAGIVFDRSTPRGTSKAPIYQLWLDQAGKLRQLTDLKVPALLSGLAPLQASADGNRLILEYGGEDTSYAWTLQLSPLQVKPLRVTGEPVDDERVQGSEISSDGKQLLIDVGAFESAPDNGEVESVGFNGGTPTKLVKGSQPSWSN